MGIEVTKTLTNKKFSNLKPKLSPELLSAIENVEKFEFMTTVQSHVIPLFMGNKDVMCEACTGSGKTLSFVIPSLHRLITAEYTDDGFYLLILSPTRELAHQTFTVITRLAEHITQMTSKKIKTTSCVGGITKIDENLTEIEKEKPQILIATPGRLEDLLQRSKQVQARMKKLEVLIIDEADQMLDIGFEKSIQFILTHCPKQRRTGLFSATLNDSVLRLKKAGLRNPHSVSVKEKNEENLATPQELILKYQIVEPQQKLSLLISIIKSNPNKRILVYFLTCAMVDYFHIILKQMAPTLVLKCHRNLDPKTRSKSVKDFSERKDGIMLASDLLGRGVDIQGGIDIVIQFDPPKDPKFFVHRAGRTARAGQKGENILFLTEEENENNYLDFLNRNQKTGEQQKIENTEIEQIDIETIRQLQIKDKRNFELAQKAFPSFIMAYKNHECKYIFREKDLIRNIGRYATCFGLLRMPKLEELKYKTIEHFTDSDYDISKLDYKDKSIRNQRKQTEAKRLEERNKAAARKKAEKTKAWSIQKDKKLKKELKRKRKEEAASRRITTEEMDDINEDYKNLKKRLKGKITEKQLDNKLGLE